MGLHESVTLPPILILGYSIRNQSLFTSVIVNPHALSVATFEGWTAWACSVQVRAVFNGNNACMHSLCVQFVNNIHSFCFLSYRSIASSKASSPQCAI